MSHDVQVDLAYNLVRMGYTIDAREGRTLADEIDRLRAELAAAGRLAAEVCEARGKECAELDRVRAELAERTEEFEAVCKSSDEKSDDLICERAKTSRAESEVHGLTRELQQTRDRLSTKLVELDTFRNLLERAESEARRNDPTRLQTQLVDALAELSRMRIARTNMQIEIERERLHRRAAIEAMRAARRDLARCEEGTDYLLRELVRTEAELRTLSVGHEDLRARLESRNADVERLLDQQWSLTP